MFSAQPEAAAATHDLGLRSYPPATPEINAVEPLAHLLPRWPVESLEAPSAAVIKAVERTLTLLAARGLSPDRLIPSLEGGICLAFEDAAAASSRYADLTFLNSGEIVASCAPDPGAEPHRWNVGADDLPQALAAVESFLAG
jgi:hypothetical protein